MGVNLQLKPSFFSWSGKLIDTYVHLLNNILATPNDYFRFISNGKCQFRIWLSRSKCCNNKGGRKKKNILHLDILKWYNVFQLCQRFCIKVLHIYCKNAFDDSFMPPSQKWTGVLKCQKLKIVSHTIHGIPFKNTNKTSI